MLARATRRSGCYEPIDLLQLAFAGRMGVWFVTRGDELRAVAVTQIIPYPRKRVLDVPFIAGTGLREWQGPLLGALEDHARATGCACLAGYDRRGWARVGGFAERGSILVRDL